MRAVLTRQEMRAADQDALAHVSHQTLVDRAGTAVAHAALRMLGGAYPARITVIAGKGSNGADGQVAATLLARRGARVTVLGAADAPPALGPCDLVIDAAYGTGFHGAYDPPTLSPGTPVLAIDIPSGIDADSGAAGGRAVRATRTVTFAALKPGLLQGDGPDRCGAVEVADIGITWAIAAAALIDDDDLRAQLPPRPRSTHKWANAVAVAAGSPGMEGSAILCSRGAMAAGAGMVRLGSPGDPQAAWPTEVVRVSLAASGWATAFLAAAEKCKAVVIGPGLGTDPATQDEIRAVVARCPLPLIIDADGLSALADADDACALLAGRSAPTVLTPHDGEYARLAGVAPGTDRLAAARDLADRLGCIVLLKGSLTAVASPQAGPPDVYLSAAGTPALATAGTGDVLSGIIAAFVARGVEPHLAAALAAHAHGRAASRGRSQGLVAGDLPRQLRRVLSDAVADD
jgi:NAD(P)H-hydrate epimerase